jgi:hypothetical protein
MVVHMMRVSLPRLHLQFVVLAATQEYLISETERLVLVDEIASIV